MPLNNKRPLIIAHRGASAHAPENTIAAFQKAVEDRAQGIEFDVRLAKDGVPVVFHDATLKRICGVEKKVSSIASWGLKEFDAGAWFSKKRGSDLKDFTGEQIPTLTETLGFLRNYQGIVYIELKATNAEVEKLSNAVCDIIGESKMLEQIFIKSFKLEAIPFVKRACPKVSTAALFAPKISNALRKEKHLINISRELGVDRLSVHFSLATRKLVNKALEFDLPVTIWTADSGRWISKSIKQGIDHIITNEPAKLLAKKREFFDNL